MAKRGNGEGTIVKRNDGRYMGSVTIGRNINGKAIVVFQIKRNPDLQIILVA